MTNSELLAPAFTINEYYELRLYEMVPTRKPGFHPLMERDVPPLFARAGIPRPLAIWENVSGPIAPLYAYLLPWSNLDERMRAWSRFYGDPEWVARRDANYAGQQRNERTHISILRPSPAWTRLRDPTATGPVGGLHEILIQELLNDDPGKAHEALAETDLPFLQAQGATVLGVFMTWFGTRMNQAVSILAWPNMETRQRAMTAHDSAPEVLAVRDAERRTFGRPLFGRAEVHLVTPVSYGIPHHNLVPRP